MSSSYRREFAFHLPPLANFISLRSLLNISYASPTIGGKRIGLITPSGRAFPAKYSISAIVPFAGIHLGVGNSYGRFRNTVLFLSVLFFFFFFSTANGVFVEKVAEKVIPPGQTVGNWKRVSVVFVRFWSRESVAFLSSEKHASVCARRPPCVRTIIKSSCERNEL